MSVHLKTRCGNCEHVREDHDGNDCTKCPSWRPCKSFVERDTTMCVCHHAKIKHTGTAHWGYCQDEDCIIKDAYDDHAGQPLIHCYSYKRNHGISRGNRWTNGNQHVIIRMVDNDQVCYVPCGFGRDDRDVQSRFITVDNFLKEYWVDIDYADNGVWEDFNFIDESKLD